MAIMRCFHSIDENRKNSWIKVENIHTLESYNHNLIPNTNHCVCACAHCFPPECLAPTVVRLANCPVQRVGLSSQCLRQGGATRKTGITVAIAIWSCIEDELYVLPEMTASFYLQDSQLSDSRPISYCSFLNGCPTMKTWVKPLEFSCTSLPQDLSYKVYDIACVLSVDGGHICDRQSPRRRRKLIRVKPCY